MQWITAIATAHLAGAVPGLESDRDPATIRFDDRVSVAHLIELWERAMALAGRDLPVRVVQYAAHEERSLVAYVASNQVTLEAGLAAYVRYFPTVTNVHAWTLERTATELILATTLAGPIDRAGWQAQLELELIDLARVVARLCEVHPSALRLPHAPPHTAAIADAALVQPTCAYPRCELAWPLAAGARELAGARPHVAALVEPLLVRMLEVDQRNRPLTERVRTALARMPAGARWSSPEIARAVGMSRRSLERALAGEGTSVIEILDREQQAAATAWLGELTVDEVAARLGYSDPRAFARAYKRWTGHPPSSVRRAR